MTDQTPRTEAGRRAQVARDQLSDRYYHEAYGDGSSGGELIEDIDILAIEAQARAEADARHSQHDYNAGVADGLAQARAEGLDVEVLAEAMASSDEVNWPKRWVGNGSHDFSWVARQVAGRYRAILAGETDR